MKSKGVFHSGSRGKNAFFLGQLRAIASTDPLYPFRSSQNGIHTGFLRFRSERTGTKAPADLLNDAVQPLYFFDQGMRTMIKLEHVDKYFGDLHVLKDVNLEVREGEKLVIIGPSGSGTSTTVRCMNFLETPTSGNVYIDGEELTAKNRTKLVRRTTSMVFQQFNLYSHMTVLRNLTLAPMKLHHKSRKEAEELAYHYLDVVGLRDKAHVYPTTLSGGQQRIAIARALCAQTKIILFDEPTSALDPETIQEVLDVMIKLAKENITMVVVTHEMGFARQVADRIVFMADGMILEEGAPDEFFENPSNERLKQFLGKIIRK